MTNMHTTEPDLPNQAVLVSVQLADVNEEDFRESLGELGRLAKTLGLRVIGEVTQRRDSFDPATYLGTGKLADLKACVNADPEHIVVLLDHEVSPSQARNLQKATLAQAVLDRTALILEIFHRHARTKAAKLQVEIVRLSYMAPRLREMGKGGDRQRGGIGGKGAGESEIELDRRKLRDRIAELKEELEAIEAERVTQRARRQGVRRVALCGYTNAGKSTLFHALTGSETYIADKLFATLDTTVRTLAPETKPRILVSDTIGFIRNLPTKLVASFKSTLDEALEASLILHVLDASDPAWPRHMATTQAVLTEIGAGNVPQRIVFNKLDRLQDPETLASAHPELADALRISAKSKTDINRVHDLIVDFFDQQLMESEILLPYDKQGLRGEIFESAQVLEESYVEEGVVLRIRAEPAFLGRIQQQGFSVKTAKPAPTAPPEDPDTPGKSQKHI